MKLLSTNRNSRKNSGYALNMLLLVLAMVFHSNSLELTPSFGYEIVVFEQWEGEAEKEKKDSKKELQKEENFHS